MHSRFRTVIVIGYGKTAGDVLRYVLERQELFGYRALCIEHEFHGLSKLRALCEEAGADFKQITDKRELTKILLAIEEPTLVVSAGNNYLFPKAVVEKDALEIINFHSALLPKFPGRNAPSWVIYEGESVTGATWHYVTAGVDSGAIIAQRETPVTEDIRAYELTRDIMVQASVAFQEFYEEQLVQRIKGRPQPGATANRKLYYSWELPGGGVCSVNDPAEDIYRLLRAMDYGRSGIFPPARIRLADGREAEVVRYSKAEAKFLKDGQRAAVDEEEERIYLAMGGGYELTIKFRLR